MSEPGEAPAFSPGARDLLRTLLERGLRPEAVPAAAALTIALDRGVRPRASASSSRKGATSVSADATSASSTSASTGGTDAAASELLAMFDEIEADR